MNSRTWVWGVIVAAALGGLLAQPQTCAAQDENVNSLQPGAWAVQFRISENFTLSTFAGSILSVKRQFSAHAAVRAGLSLSFETSDFETSVQDTTLSKDDVNAFGFRLELQYLRYTRPQGKLSPFWGVGPLVGYMDSGSKFSSGTTTARQDTRQWDLGMVGSLGVEWFPVSFISVHAEYGLAFTYSTFRSEQKVDSTQSRVQESSAWRFQGDGVLFGLSLYF